MYIYISTYIYILVCSQVTTANTVTKSEGFSRFKRTWSSWVLHGEACFSFYVLCTLRVFFLSALCWCFNSGPDCFVVCYRSLLLQVSGVAVWHNFHSKLKVLIDLEISHFILEVWDSFFCTDRWELSLPIVWRDPQAMLAQIGNLFKKIEPHCPEMRRIWKG